MGKKAEVIAAVVFSSSSMWECVVCVVGGWLALLVSPGPVRIWGGVGLQACGALGRLSQPPAHTLKRASMLDSMYHLLNFILHITYIGAPRWAPIVLQCHQSGFSSLPSTPHPGDRRRCLDWWRCCWVWELADCLDWLGGIGS